MIKYFYALLVFWSPYLVNGQRYTGEAPLPAASADGYHKIAIDPWLSKYLTEGFANLRIASGDGAEVPYVVDEAAEYRLAEFESYPIEEKVQLEKCCTRLVFSNPRRQKISHLHLKVRNADVNKEAMIEGSDDAKTWYVVKDWFTLNRFSNRFSTTEFRIIDFPLVDYAHLKMTISDSVTAPLNIEAVGFYRDSVAVGRYNPLENATISIKEHRQKETHITIKMDTLEWIDKITIRPTGPPLFQRKAIVYSVAYTKNKRGRIVREEEYLGETMLTNDSTVDLPLANVHAREILISVENGDSPALRFENIQLLQRVRTVIAYLEKDKKYLIKIGSPETPHPVYDLASLRDKINGTLSIIKPGPMTVENTETRRDTPTFFTSAYMWAAIAGIVVLLGFLSVKMIRELQ